MNNSDTLSPVLQKEPCIVIWLGPHTPTLETLSSQIDIYHVYTVHAALSVLQHNIAPCVIIDTRLPNLNLNAFLNTLQSLWPQVEIIALGDFSDTDQTQLETNQYLDLSISPSDLKNAIYKLIARSSWHSTKSDYNVLEERARHLEGLLRQSSLISGTRGVDNVLDSLREVAQVAVDADDIAVLLIEKNETELSDSLNLGVPETYLDVCRTHFQSLSPDKRQAYVGEEVLLRQRQPDKPPASVHDLEIAGAKAWSYIRLPLTIEQRLIGFVALFSQQPGQFDGTNLQLARLFAEQVTMAVRNQRLYIRLNRAEQQQQAVSEVARMLAEELTLNAVLDHIVQDAVRLAGGSSGVVLLVQSDQSLVVSAVHNRSPDLLGHRVPSGTGQVGIIAVTGRPSVVTGASSQNQEFGSLQDPIPENSFLFGVPLSYRQLVLGVLQVVRDQHAPGDAQAVQDVLMMLAPQAATAIAKAQLQETVHQERRQLQAILDHTPASVIMCDAKGRISLANPEAEQALERLGFLLEKIKGQRVIDLVADWLPENISADTIPQAVEVLLGEHGEYVVHIAPITREDGVIGGYVGVAQDVTEIRRMDRVKSNLNRVLTHDLGNLLMLAQNPLRLLDEPDLSSEHRAQLKSMLISSLERMETLIKDVMELEMVPSFDLETIIPYKLVQLARQSVERNQTVAEQQQITLVYEEIEEIPHTLYGHAMLIMQAIDNLVSNALKYTPPGGHVVVSTQITDQHAVVKIKDNGYGIPKDKLTLVFEPFVRVKDARTRNIPGTGLGLNLVKTFVEAHGGTVKVESEIDVGSVFSIHLPLKLLETKSSPTSTLISLDLSRLVNNARMNGA